MPACKARSETDLNQSWKLTVTNHVHSFQNHPTDGHHLARWRTNPGRFLHSDRKSQYCQGPVAISPGRPYWSGICACVPGEKEAVTNINQWAQQEGFVGCVEVLGFVDHTKSVDWILETGGGVINLLTKGSEKHCREQLGKTLAQHTGDILQTVNYALEKGLKVNVYLEDWSNGYQDSPDYVYGLMDNLRQSGIQHFMLPIPSACCRLKRYSTIWAICVIATRNCNLIFIP